MPERDDDMVATAERRKMSLIDLAKKCGAIILSNGEVWDGVERREGGRPKNDKSSKDKGLPDVKSPCDFFG